MLLTTIFWYIKIKIKNLLFHLKDHFELQQLDPFTPLILKYRVRLHHSSIILVSTLLIIIIKRCLFIALLLYSKEWETMQMTNEHICQAERV